MSLLDTPGDLAQTPLAAVLLQAGKIDIDALSVSLSLVAKTKRPQGEILVEMGVVAPEVVAETLAEQQAAYFRVIAALDAGAYRFEAAPPPEWTRSSRLSPVRTIVDALERPQAAKFVAAALQPVASTAIRLSSGYAAFAGAVRWSDAERELVDRVSAPELLETYLAPSQVPPARARAILAALLLLGLAVPAAGLTEPSGELVVDLAVEPEFEAEKKAAARPAPSPAPAAPAPPTAPTVRAAPAAAAATPPPPAR